MISSLKLLVSVSLLAATPFALASDGKGAYLGFNLGSTSFDDDGLHSRYSFLDIDDSDSKWGIYGGYNFTTWFGVEGQYSDLGSYKASYTSTNAFVEYKGDEFQSFSVAAKFRTNFSEKFNLFAKTGIAYLEATESIKFTSGRSASYSDSAGALYLAAGAAFYLSKQVSISAEYESHTFGVETGSSNYSETYTQQVSSFNLGFQYDF